ncbi:hypothetical protein K1719_033696 [Acacia pycnantha]|nr:hypothetical protein K1719_033696 [Acacia pycnantha]
MLADQMLLWIFFGVSLTQCSLLPKAKFSGIGFSPLLFHPLPVLFFKAWSFGKENGKRNKGLMREWGHC